MRHHSEFNERIVQGVRDALILTDPTGHILEVNSAFERMYGYSRDDVEGQPVSLLKSGRHDDTFYHHLWQALRRGMVWEGNIYNKRKDDSVLLVEEIITPLFDADGQVEYYLASMRENIMYGWLSEKGFKAAGPKDAMTATLAHDLSNLITPLLDSAGTAKDKLDQGDSPTEELERICRNGARAKELLRQVLAFCRHEYGGRKYPVSFSHIVNDVVGILEQDLPEEITLRTEFLQKNPVVLGESVQLHQVLMNLCSNAVTAMRTTGGCLKITLENLLVNNNSPYLGDLLKGDYLKLSVSDTGIGMDTDGIRRAFDPYYSTRDDTGEGEGHGLGLSIVRKIVEDHMGKVYLKSSLGEGCTVDVILPNGSPQGANETQQIPVAIVPVKTGAILFVDDQHSIRQMGKNMLEYAGFTVQGAGGISEALERFSSTPFGFDLLITDQVVSGAHAELLIKGIRAARKDIPIIIMTSQPGTVSDATFGALDNCKVLAKPFSSQDLLNAVRELVED